MFSVEVLVAFHVLILAMLALDLGLFHRKAHEVGIREACIWSGVWVILALAFDGLLFAIWPDRDEAHEKAVTFLACYILEKSMSLDNLFVFTVIFAYFQVPKKLQYKILFWGILGAFFFRGSLITLGAVAIYYLHFLTYFLAVALFWLAYKLFTAGDGDPVDPSENAFLKFAKRHFRVAGDFEAGKFFMRKEGLLYATPLFLVLLVVESTDIMFATDSIPAMLGMTQDGFIIYTSNIFAILGLRSMFFVIHHFLNFRFLNAGLGAIMAFVATKIFIQDFIPIGTILSCSIIVGILMTAVLASLAFPNVSAVEQAPIKNGQEAA